MTREWRRLAIAAAVTGLMISGCEKKELSDSLAGDNADAGGGDAMGGGNAAGGAGGSGDATGGAGGESAPGLHAGVEPMPDGCTEDRDCSGDICRLGVCVLEPPSDRASNYSCDDELVPDSSPDFDCWDEPPTLADGPSEVAVSGVVDYFGDGSRTVNLRIAFYDYDTFDPTPCLDVGDGAADLIGAREATETCIDDNLTPLGETVSVPCPNRDDRGCYELEGLPTGKHLVVRVTGELRRWVPTYTYRVFINPCVNDYWKEGGVCPEQRPEAPADHDWSCSLRERDGESYFDLEVTAISTATYTTFPPTAGVPRITRGNGAVAGRQYDCVGRPVVNATVGFHQRGRLTTYFNGDPDDTLPQPGLTHTNLTGTYATLDAAAGPSAMVAIGRKNGEVRTLNFYRYFLLPNTIVILSPSGRLPTDAVPPF